MTAQGPAHLRPGSSLNAKTAAGATKLQLRASFLPVVEAVLEIDTEAFRHGSTENEESDEPESRPVERRDEHAAGDFTQGMTDRPGPSKQRIGQVVRQSIAAVTRPRRQHLQPDDRSAGAVC